VLADALRALGDPDAAEHRRAASAWRDTPGGVPAVADPGALCAVSLPSAATGGSSYPATGP
jgi:hypothetical protein